MNISEEENKMCEAQADQSKKCTLCLRMIENTKFRLHDIMCHKQNYKCATCNEIVPKQDRA